MSFSRRIFCVGGLVGLALGQTVVLAAARHSQSYSVVDDSSAANGSVASSESYGAISMIGGGGGSRQFSDGSGLLLQGLSSSLYSLESLTISRPTAHVDGGSGGSVMVASVNEGELLPLEITLHLDDETLVSLNSGDVDLVRENGPSIVITAGSVVSVGTVASDSVLTLKATYGGIDGEYNVMVLNTRDDNYGFYADDGLSDQWQVSNFGDENPNGRADADPDGDGQNNFFESMAGLNPLNPESRFELSLERDISNPNVGVVTFSPRLDGIHYVVESTTNVVSGEWVADDGVVTDSGSERHLADNLGGAHAKFYRVRIIR